MFIRSIKLPELDSFFLFGARGTGKSTLLKSQFLGSVPSPEGEGLRSLIPGERTHAKALYLDLLDGDLFADLSLRPAGLEERLRALPHVNRIIIDEVQKVPALLDTVQRLMGEFPRRQFILTGSSARKLKRGGGNLLGGRAFVYHLFPLLSDELGVSFHLEHALHWGTLPKIMEFAATWQKKEFLNAYAQTYLREEILQEQLIRKLEPFQRFLPIAAQVSGQPLNYSKIAKDVGCAPQTVETYFNILQDTWVGFFLPAYHPSVRKQEKFGPKFYLFDNGVQRALSRQLGVEVSPGTYAFGNAFEHFVIQQIRHRLDYKRDDAQLYYYATQGGIEIDLILKREGSPPTLIEIKSAERVRDDHVRHLQSVCGDFRSSPAYCFSLDPARKKIGAVLCLHWLDGLRELGVLAA